MPKVIPINKIEDIRNRVDSLLGDVDDNKYPSAKAVKEYVDANSGSGGAGGTIPTKTSDLTNDGEGNGKFLDTNEVNSAITAYIEENGITEFEYHPELPKGIVCPSAVDKYVQNYVENITIEGITSEMDSTTFLIPSVGAVISYTDEYILPNIPTKISNLENDSNYASVDSVTEIVKGHITSDMESELEGEYVESLVPNVKAVAEYVASQASVLLTVYEDSGWIIKEYANGFVEGTKKYVESLGGTPGDYQTGNRILDFPIYLDASKFNRIDYYSSNDVNVIVYDGLINDGIDDLMANVHINYSLTSTISESTVLYFTVYGYRRID